MLLGDVVDRGPGTPQCIDQLMYLAAHGRLTFVRGNHEEMMIDAVLGGPMLPAWLRYGGQEVLRAYGGDPMMIPPPHIDFLRSSIDYWADDRVICVHASLDPQLDLEEQTPDVLRWTRFTAEEPEHPSGRRVLCGHTVQSYGVPSIHNNWVCLDTGAYTGQFLSCLELETDLLYQGSQSGQTRGPVPLLDVAIQS